MIDLDEQAARLSRIPLTLYPARHPWLRTLVLLSLLFISIALYIVLMQLPPRHDGLGLPFLQVWMVCFVPYFAACALVFVTRPVSGRWRWVELGIVLVGALVVRVMLLPLSPGLSRDSWRYLWDARVTLHGYSPYVYAPIDKALIPLRNVLFDQSRFRTVPTIYPPGAQGVFLVSYLLAPDNLVFLKGIFLGFDIASCVALVLLLMRRGLDPRRVIVYAWCPLPIVEFAIQGHMDVLAITFTLLAVLAAEREGRGARAWTGFLIGLATLTKIYPLILLVAVVRRRDWTLLAVCFATIIVGYIPYLMLGHGQVFGFFASYASEQGGNTGVVPLLVHAMSAAHGFKLAAIVTLEQIVDVLVVGAVSLAVLVLRGLGRISIEAASLLLIGTILAISSHVFPWYTTALLPWVALLPGPIWTWQGLSAKTMAVVMVWYFCCISLTGYLFGFTNDWHLYYESVYNIVLAGLGVALILGLYRQLQQLKRFSLEGSSK